MLTSEKYEADDVIGTLATSAIAEGLEVVIVTGDKDFFQLVDDSVTVFDPRDAGTWYHADEVQEKMGVRPAQVVDVLSLMGDAVDNVKGVPGIGQKGARELIGTVRIARQPAGIGRRKFHRSDTGRPCSSMPTMPVKARRS